ncbi:MAG TPA: hypothetical protein VGK99_12390 [Acidobacteriota bacterium]|jgi:hypothetical protein
MPRRYGRAGRVHDGYLKLLKRTTSAVTTPREHASVRLAGNQSKRKILSAAKFVT